MKFLRFIAGISMFFVSLNVSGQSFKSPRKFGNFGKIQVNYGLGLNDILLEQKANPFQIKVTWGKQNDHFGVGLGIATANFRNRSDRGGINLNTTSFSLNTHYTFSDFSDDDNKLFVRAGAGYAPKIFGDYSKGFLYDGSLGYIITNKKGAKYFIEAQYQVQYFDDFLYRTNRVKGESVGLGIGIWF